ncbi:MAG: hypothetical protein Q9163_002376 [Psora crenata]
MTLTRSQLGETPKRTQRPPGYVETPTRRSTRGLKSTTAKSTDASNNTPEPSQNPQSASKETIVNGHVSPRKSRGCPPKTGKADHKIDMTGQFEFGGPVGVTAIMAGFPILMWYMWIGATYYEGKIPWPKRDESWLHFILLLGNLVYDGAFPTLKAWVIYWAFIVFETVCYLYLPGIYVKGKPLEWEGGERLDYYCSGVWSFPATIVVAALLHVTGLFKLYTIIDEFGPLMSVAIISGFLVSIIAYISALYRGADHRMTGHHVYDFFMGAELNPRMFGLLDLKMLSEVRIPWYMLFLVTCGAAARQYEQNGYIPGEVWFMLMAHFLYANACSKAEELITTTWDMYHEKWGFMLIFWNMAGVPLSYCHASIYLANRAPSVYQWNPIALSILYILYIFVYWVWDTCNSQKNRFRQEERGTLLLRKTFPQLPWLTVKNPKTIKTKTGDSILVDGWYKRRYGPAWEEYERQVPYWFIPAERPDVTATVGYARICSKAIEPRHFLAVRFAQNASLDLVIVIAHHP